MQTYYSYDNVKFWFLPTSSHLLPLYLNTNKSPLEAVVVKVGAVSSLNSNTAFQAIVLDPVPSWIQTIEINCPVVGLVGASKVTLFVKVTFATGEALTSQSCVASKVNVASSKYIAPVIFVKLLASAVNTLDAAVVPSVARSE